MISFKKLSACVLVLSIGWTGVALADSANEISGAGATFPFPIYSMWSMSYTKQSGVKINYAPIGSGGGIKRIESKSVAFGASDAPLKPEELDNSGLIQFPTIMGGVVPVVNLPGVAPSVLRLDGQTLGDIFLGKITRWDAPAIRALNPELSLPAMAITVVHRSDSSGTTWIFTNYLSKVNRDWAEKISYHAYVDWPVGKGVDGSQGMVERVARTKGAIGYVEYTFAKRNEMTYVKVRNRDGQFVEPNARNFQAAAVNADWAHAPGFYMALTDQPGKESWPIAGATFILVHKTQASPEVGQAVLKFFNWAYGEGDRLVELLNYVPMPESVVQIIEQRWAQEITDAQGKPIWSGT